MDFDEIIEIIKAVSETAAEYLPQLKVITAADLFFVLTYYRKIRWRIKKLFRFCFMLITLILIILVLIMASWNS